MRLLILTTIVIFTLGCVSKGNKTSNRSSNTDDPYTDLAKIYLDKIDQIWMKKIKDVPDFASGFAKCTNDYEIAQWMDKHLSKEIDWHTDQLQEALLNHYISEEASFTNNEQFMESLSKRCAKVFRADLLKIYVGRHEIYKNKGYFNLD